MLSQHDAIDYKLIGNQAWQIKNRVNSIDSNQWPGAILHNQFNGLI